MRTLSKTQLDDEYLIYKTLTPGKRYKTYLAMKADSTGNPHSVILKEMDEKRAHIYFSLESMWNPYLPDTYDVFQLVEPADPKQNCYVAVTEYVSANGSPEEECLSLTQFVYKHGPLTDTTSLSICAQICEGLKEFHEKGFVHRDLKPDNIMIAEYHLESPKIKVIDFGGAKHQNPNGNADTTVIGTLGYQPPESLSSRATNRADIYSVGCILNFMLTGQEPGIKVYRGKHSIERIIEKATNIDPSYRYKSILSMKRDIEHELRTTLWDKIPISPLDYDRASHTCDIHFSSVFLPLHRCSATGFYWKMVGSVQSKMLDDHRAGY